MSDNEATIQRCPHDLENPYTMVLNSLARDETISPNCRWLIWYLLTNKEGWKIKVSQIYAHVKNFIGRDKVYKLFDEAIEAGYMKKEEKKVPRKGGGALNQTIYYVSERPKFKKFYRLPENQDTGDQYPGHQDDKERTSKERLNPPPPTPSLPQPESSEPKKKEEEGKIHTLLQYLADCPIPLSQAKALACIETFGIKAVTAAIEHYEEHGWETARSFEAVFTNKCKEFKKLQNLRK